MTLKNNNIRAIIVTVLSFLFLFFIAYRYTNFKRGQWEKDVRTAALDVLIGKKSKLEKALYSRIYYTKGLASFVSLNPNITIQEFNILAKDFLKSDTVIGSLSLAKDCIIGAIYPLEGHEAAIGLDLLKHPERVEIVDKTIETRKTFVAGPVNLVEGGVAFISYTPVFDKTQVESGIFWGVTDIVIKMEALFKESGLETVEDNFKFALRGYNGTGIKGKVFYGEDNVFRNNPETVTINLPYGTWELASTPVSGWESFYSQDRFLYLSLILSSFIISILLGLLVRAILKIQANERRMKAIFNSLDSLIIEFDKNGKYLSVASTQLGLLARPSSELIGMNISEIVDADTAILYKEAFSKCIQNKELVVIEYPLIIEGNKRWFQGRVSYKNDNSVIFNAIDITKNKDNEESIMQSNQMKDNLISVLAHDLRNPLGHFMQMTDFLVENFESVERDEMLSNMKLMKDSGKDVYNLLENILDWQVTRKNSKHITLTSQDIKPQIDTVLTQLNALAVAKNIKIVNCVKENSCAIVNEKLFDTIIRNLVVNAIKYSYSGDEIIINSNEITENDTHYLKINITDKGVGMNENQMKMILGGDKVKVIYGTEKEKGSGLGLIICKEFIELLEGEFSIESSEGKGSTFFVMLKSGSEIKYKAKEKLMDQSI